MAASDAQQLCTKLFNILAEELDIPLDELEDEDVDFVDLGIDKILARSIITKTSDETGLQLPEDVFTACPSVGQLKQHICSIVSAKFVKPIEYNSTHGQRQAQRSLSVLMQGNRAKATRNIFLLPDGSGSAMAYARIPAIAPDVCLYALNSPFLQKASTYTTSIEQLAAIWAREIERIQPSGPYVLGGWSAGGYYAYEVMRYFQRKGESVEKIVLIDSPCRTDYEALPFDVVLYLAENKLLGDFGGGSGTPKWLVDHFESTLRAVGAYEPSPVDAPRDLIPEVFIIWAEDSLLGKDAFVRTGLNSQVRVSRMLLEPRTDFGPSGWDKLFARGGDVMTDLRIATIPGNHFNIIRSPQVSEYLLLIVSSQWKKGSARPKDVHG